MTTETEPVPALSQRIPIAPRAANTIMKLASRIGWAENELRGLGALVRRGDEVLDVGAAHGMYTFPLAHLVGPEGRVHSFEPHPRQQRTLARLQRLLGTHQVTVHNAAVGSARGEFTMRLPLRFGLPIYGHAHIMDGSESVDSDQAVRYWRTPVLTVDEWSDASGTGPLRFIKVDVEGFEPSVIAGARRTIERSLPSLLLEIEDRHLSRYGRDANAFANELRATWPEYRMYTWVEEAWKPTQRISVAFRNYLLATDEAFTR